jgi:hypothetical protein
LLRGRRGEGESYPTPRNVIFLAPRRPAIQFDDGHLCRPVGANCSLDQPERHQIACHPTLPGTDEFHQNFGLLGGGGGLFVRRLSKSRLDKAAVRPLGHLGFHGVNIVTLQTGHSSASCPSSDCYQALLALRAAAHVHKSLPSISDHRAHRPRLRLGVVRMSS